MLHEACLATRLTIRRIKQSKQDKTGFSRWLLRVAMWRKGGKFKRKMESTKRVRKPNFSAAECALILDLAEQNIETIREKFSLTLTNKKKNEVWQMISNRVNAIGVAKRTPNDVREKWRAMRGEARKDMVKENKAMKKTGGGKPDYTLKPTSQRIIEVFGDEPGFSGIKGGIDSGKFM